MPTHDSASFFAGHAAGVRVSACLARLAAQELVEEARWWNRWRRRLMARALVACAEELEETAEARRAAAPQAPPISLAGRRGAPPPRG